MEQGMREFRQRKFMVSAEPDRFDAELIAVRIDTGAQSTMVISLLPEEWGQVMDVVKQALKASLR